MNDFVICLETYMAPLADKAMAPAENLGVVEVDMGDTECKVPDAVSYIFKSRRAAEVAPNSRISRYTN